MPIHLVESTTSGPLAASPARDRAAQANHLIANSLTVIAGLARLQASHIGDDARALDAREVRLILEGFGGRTDTVARLHQLLAHADEDAAIDLAGYQIGRAHV